MRTERRACSSVTPSVAGIIQSAPDVFGIFEIDTIGARFVVVRGQIQPQIRARELERRLAKGVRSDSVIRFSVYKSARDYPRELRRVAYHDEETDKDYVFLTNDLDSSALVIADLYHDRWQVELFFKWLKTAPADKEVLGHHGERRAHPNILCHNHLLPRGDSATRYVAGAQRLRSASDSQYLADRQHASDRSL